MSTYSFPTILLTSFGGTEPKPATQDRSAGTPPVAGVGTVAGHTPDVGGRPPNDGHDQATDELDAAPPPAKAVENIGRVPVAKHRRSSRRARHTDGPAGDKPCWPRKHLGVSGPSGDQAAVGHGNIPVFQARLDTGVPCKRGS